MIPIFKKGWLGNKKEFFITSPMGLRNGRMHNGIDIRSLVGTNIFAPTAGRIMNIKTQKQGAGLYIVLRFNISLSEYYTIYFMHLREVKVSIGEFVEEGKLIALSGGDPSDIPNCGRSTGPHLHFEIRKQGTIPVNPIYFLSEKCTLEKTNKVIWEGRNSLLDSKDLHSVSEYQNSDITTISSDNGIEIDKKIINNKSISSVNQRLAPGIWQIVKLLIDSSAANRQIFDSSISMQTGSLINFFNKVCQKPLVEFFGDTYGDQYYFFVRKPPFDKESILKMQKLAIINIENKDIKSTNLNWKSENIYSWYQMIPYSEFGEMTQLTLYMPAIFFPEYAAVWGSKELAVQNQYVNYYKSGKINSEINNNDKLNGENIIRNSIKDLKYLIESNAYNPFVREGTIILNGDRRIKRGTLIMMPNGEQFYVDSVSNNYFLSETSVDRTTTLTVSHGMFSDFIKGIEINGKKMSYFNIIDYGKDFDIEKITTSNWKDKLSTWKVNIDVFSYFLKRSQILDKK